MPSRTRVVQSLSWVALSSTCAFFLFTLARSVLVAAPAGEPSALLVERIQLVVDRLRGELGIPDTVDVAIERGVRVVDDAAGGLGGCPFAPGAPGNAATEAIVRHLHERGFETGVDVDAIEDAVAIVRPYLSGRAPA